MYQDGIICKAVETYYGSTGITTFYIDVSGNISFFFSEGLDYSSLKEFLGFDEVLDFITTSLTKAENSPARAKAFHTYCTHKGLLYNIVFVDNEQASAGAVVSGPLLLYYPDEKAIDSTLMSKKLPLHRKEEFKGLLGKVPFAAFERITQLGRSLYALCGSDPGSWYSAEQLTHGRESPDVKAVYDMLISAGYDEKENSLYQTIYEFMTGIKNAIMHGSLEEMDKLLGRSAHLLWDLKAYGDNSSMLKNRCIIMCTTACIYSIQANAPYDRMMYIFEKFINKVRTLNSSDEIIELMITILKTFTHAVAVSTQNIYSLHVNRILNYIKNHYTEKITLAKLAEYTHLNLYYLSSQIKKETKLSLADNINKIRIEESKKLLIYTNKSVNEIACAVGYNYQNHFNAVFKRFEGMTPLEFRKNNISSNLFKD